MNQRSSKIGWLISSDFSFFNFFSGLPVTNSRKGSSKQSSFPSYKQHSNGAIDYGTVKTWQNYRRCKQAFLIQQWRRYGSACTSEEWGVSCNILVSR